MCDPILVILLKMQPQSIQLWICDSIQRHIPFVYSLRLKGSTTDQIPTISHEDWLGLSGNYERGK